MCHQRHTETVLDLIRIGSTILILWQYNNYNYSVGESKRILLLPCTITIIIARVYL